MMNPYFNEITILEYIKKNLGVPYNILELDDDYIINEIITNHTYLKEFSQYFPKEERMRLTRENNEQNYLLSLKQKYPDKYRNIDIPIDDNYNVWILESNNEILGVKKVINNPINDSIAYYTDIASYINPTEGATFDLSKSLVYKTISHKFIYPNRLEVKGYARMAEMLAIMEVVHDKDLSSIPSSLHLEYTKLCLYNTAAILLNIRNKYLNMSTPFGELNVNVDYIQQLADKKLELIQSFESPANFAARGLGIIVI